MHPLASNWCDLDLYNQYCILNLGSYRRCHSTYRHLHLVLNFHQILSWCIWHKSIHDHSYWHLIAKFHPVDDSIFSWSNWGNRLHIIAICGSVSRINCHCYLYFFTRDEALLIHIFFDHIWICNMYQSGLSLSFPFGNFRENVGAFLATYIYGPKGYLHPRRGAQCVNFKGNSAAPM